MFYTKKIYRILIKVLLTAVILFILTSAVISFFYEKAVIRYLKSYLDEHLRTQITVDDIHFRLLKGFPNASIELRNIVVLSGENFSASDFTAIDADTLLEAKRLTFQFDFIKLLRSNYELKQINIARGHVNILFDKNNRNNLSVWKKNSKNSAQDDYNFDLSSIHLNDVDVNIITASGKFSFLSNSNRLVLKGSFGASMASIEAKGNLKVNSISSGNRTLIRNANMQLQTKSHYSNGQIKLEESRLLLNNLPLSFSGTVIPERENCQVNMLIAVSGFKIEDLMSLFSDDITGIPDQFNIDGNGSLMISLSGNPLLHGRLATNITFEFTKCTVTSERKKSAISDINMKGIASGNLIDRFFIQIDRFDASIGTGQISATVYTSAQNQKSASLHVNSTIKLNNLFHLIDNDSLKYLNGTVISDFNAEWPIGVKRSGTAHQYLSYLKKGEFIAENVEIISGRGLNLQHVGGRISIDKIFTLDSLSMTIHENEYLVNGTIDNLYNHLAHKDTLYSNLKISSKALNLSRYFEKSSVVTDTLEKPLFMFPSPMHLDAAINTGELIISKFIASNLHLNMEMRRDTAYIKDFIFKFIDGFISGNALINGNLERGFSVTCNAQARYVNIHELFTAFNNFTQHFITDENIQGRLDGSVNFFATWDRSFKYIPAGTKATANIEISNGELIDFEPMMKLSRYIDAEELAYVRFKTLKNRINIENRQITIPEMAINSSAFNITASGVHSFDNEFSYRLKVLLSEVLFNRAKSGRREIGEFYVEDNMNDQPAIPLIIAGTPENYDVIFDKQRAFTLSKQNTEINGESNSVKPDPAGFIIEWEEVNTAGSDLQKDSVKKMEGNEFVIEWDEE